MLFRKQKGIGAMLTLLILIIAVGISIFLFFSLFTYKIRIVTLNSVIKSRESLLLLSIVNQQYNCGNFAISLSNCTRETHNQIYDYIINFNEIDLSSTNPDNPGELSIYYYFNFGEPREIYYISNGKCLSNPLKCKDYTYIMKFPLPTIYDGNSFSRECIFISFT
ncbi:MAG: hypothetical protein QXI58_04445 [Candidatus Micrarchaeia archaeon]